LIILQIILSLIYFTSVLVSGKMSALN